MTVRVVEVVIWPVRLLGDVVFLVLAVKLGDGFEQVQSRCILDRR